MAFMELAELIHYSLEDLGFESAVQRDNIDVSRRNIILGVHLLNTKYIPQLPRDTILINTEQLGAVSAQWNDTVLAWFRSGLELWDYNPRNIALLEEEGITGVRRLQIGFHEKLRRIPLSDTPDVDVLFYGSLNERRIRILKGLQARGFAVKHLFGVYGAERDQWIARSKLVLNLHYYPTEIFEIVRVSYLLNNGLAVVGEVSPTTTMDPWVRQAIAATPYEGLTGKISELITGGSWREQGRAGLNAIRAYPQTPIIRDLL